ncbi:MAG TPA: hypothetical protein VKX17_24845 [Planctomycetota bacterium]|nr:hypothetical protein [Planctomycetota bacterium]
MKFFSFRLSTLLLVYLTAAAILGLCLTGKVWQLAGTLALDEKQNAVSMLEFDPSAQRLLAFNGQQLYLFDLATSRKMWKQPFQINPAMHLEIRFINSGDAVEATLFNEAQLNNPVTETFHYAAADGRQQTIVHPDPRDKAAPHFAHSDFFASKSSELSESAMSLGTRIRIESSSGPDSLRDTYTIELERPADAVRYSPDGQFLAAGHEGQITLWRRTRGYGALGMAAQPLYWILVALVLVIVIKVQRFKPVE